MKKKRGRKILARTSLSVNSSSAEAESKTLGKGFTNMDLLTGE